jgi:iron(III) transport system permease protein
LAGVAADPRAALLAAHTVGLAGAVVLASAPLGSLLALLLVRTDMPLRRVSLALVGALLFIPLYVQAAAWQAGFGLTGWFRSVAPGAPWLEGWHGAVWVHTAAAIPWVTLIVAVGLRLVEPELEEEALLEGPAWRVFRRVTLRAGLGSLATAALWVALGVAAEMTVTDLFRVRTYAEELYTDFAVEPGAVSITALGSAAVTALLALAALGLAARLATPARPDSLGRPFVFRLRRARWPAALAVWAIIFPLAAVPLGSLAYKAGVVVSKTEEGAFVRAWSVVKCLTIVAESPWEYAREFRWSLELGVLAATTALVVGLALAWLARRGGMRAAPAVLATALTLAIPGPLIGIGLAWLLDRPDSPALNVLYDDDRFRPWLALTVRALPLVTLVLWHALRSLAPGPLDAAATEGAGRWRRLWRIALPQRVAAVAVAWVVGLAVALGDLAASILTLPPGVETLAVRIFGLLHSGVEDEVAGISLALLLILAAAGGAMAWGGAGNAGPSEG